MLTICELDAAGVFTGRTTLILEADGCPPDWVRAPSPAFPEGKAAQWIGDTWAFVHEPDPLPALRDARSAAVMALRDAKIDGGFTFQGQRYQTRQQDRENIAGAAQLAFMAIIAAEVQAGDLRWSDPNEDFGWITEDNAVVTMDAMTVVAFGKAAAGFKQACIFHAYDLKAAIEKAEDMAALDAIDITAGWPA